MVNFFKFKQICQLAGQSHKKTNLFMTDQQTTYHNMIYLALFKFIAGQLLDLRASFGEKQLRSILKNKIFPMLSHKLLDFHRSIAETPKYNQTKKSTDKTVLHCQIK